MQGEHHKAPAISIRNASKVFGRQQVEALGALDEGIARGDILERYDATPALHDISLSCPSGQTTILLGLSGCGKSTLLRLINGLLVPDRGEIFVEGQSLADLDLKAKRLFRRERLSMVFQQFGLLPHRSVLDNVAFGLEIQNKKRDARLSEAAKWTELVGLNGFEDARPAALSGGMRQRVGLARALCSGARILLMDEPFSALDPLTRRDMQDLVLELQKKAGKTIVFVTHDVTEAFRLGDRLAILNEGSIIQTGTSMEILNAPASDYVTHFLDNLDVLQGLVAGQIMLPYDGKTSAHLPPQTPLKNVLLRFVDQTDTLLIGEPTGPAKGQIPFGHLQAILAVSGTKTTSDQLVS